MAGAVTAYAQRREALAHDKGVETMSERLGTMSRELGEQVDAAILAFRSIKTGVTNAREAMGELLERSLSRIRELLLADSLADIRVTPPRAGLSGA